MENFTAWRGRKFSLATQKNTAVLDKQACSNKILQNKQRYTTKQPLAVSHWPLAKQRTPPQRHPDHTSFKKIKDVFDERRRITCFRISPRATAHPSPRTDAEASSA